MQISIGSETPTASGYYARVDDQPQVIAISSLVKTGLDKSLYDLRDKTILDFERGSGQEGDLDLAFGRVANGRIGAKRQRLEDHCTPGISGRYYEDEYVVVKNHAVPGSKPLRLKKPRIWRNMVWISRPPRSP